MARLSLLSVLMLADESERAAALRLGAHFIIYEPDSLSQIRSVLLQQEPDEPRGRALHACPSRFL